jgi:hypothetical protein
MFSSKGGGDGSGRCGDLFLLRQGEVASEALGKIKIKSKIKR